MRMGLILRMLGATIAVLWLTRRKWPGKNCREAAVSPLSVRRPLTQDRKFYSMKSIKYARGTAWHAARIVNGGRERYGSGRTVREL
jgi:hypothetical protein